MINKIELPLWRYVIDQHIIILFGSYQNESTGFTLVCVSKVIYECVNFRKLQNLTRL